MAKAEAAKHTAHLPIEARRVPPKPSEHNPGERPLAAMAYLGPFIIVPLLLPKKKRFLQYHTRQALYWFTVSIVALLLTIGLLFIFRERIPNAGVFTVLSVILLLEFASYCLVSLYLAFSAGRGSMPMLPLLGDLAGEG